MLNGIFMDGKGNVHQFYEVDLPQYYRLDICESGTQYHISPKGVQYSIFRKRKTLVYGDSTLLDEYKKLRDGISNFKAKESVESKWQDGAYFQIKVKENQSKGFTCRQTMKNGNLIEFEAHLGQQFLLYTVDNNQQVKMEPLNIREYTEVVLGGESSDTTSYATPYYPYEVLLKRYDLQHLLEKDFVVATTLEIAEKRLQEWIDSDAEFKGFDTETTGLDIWMYGEDKLTGIILSIDEDVSTYFPFRMKKMPNLDKAFMDKLMEACIAQQDRLVAHNKQFDRQAMLKEGYDIKIYWDTLRIALLIDPDVTHSHALKDLEFEVDHKKRLELDEIFISPKDIDFSVLDADIARIYACPDSPGAVMVLKNLIPKVPKDMWPIITVEMALSDLKADQEFYGMRVDIPKYKKNYDNCNYVLDLLLNAFRKMTGEDGNLNSSEVMSTLIYDKLGCPVLKRTSTGKRSVSGDTIDKLASQRAQNPNNITEDILDLYGNKVIKAAQLANSKYPALVILSKYREYMKRKTAFYARFERTVKCGRIGFWINQNGASSGRQSSPMHQLPPELKDTILSDSESKDLWGPDYSQVELRMIAFLAKETDLIEMCKDPENDIHRVSASLITGKPMWAITQKERGEYKRVNFGVVYLISGFGLAGQMYGPGYTMEQVHSCEEKINSFYNRFKRIDLYLKQNAIRVKEKGCMRTYFRRVKYFDKIFNPDITRRERASLIRQANNMPVQGTAADLMKIAEVNMFNYIYEKGWNVIGEDGFPRVRAMLSIHDEVLISADQSIPMEEIIEMITKCMQIDIEGAPPFFVQPACMANWGGHSDDSAAIPIPYRDQLISDYVRTGQSVFKRSFYHLELPAEESHKLLNDKRHISELVSEYKDKFVVTKKGGNYSDKLTGHSLELAVKAYIESGMTEYVDDNYRLKLKEYREGVLRDYMLDLVNKYGPDPMEVAKNVQHPSLTHQLIETAYDKMKGMDLTHVEQIQFATREYLEMLKGLADAEEEKMEVHQIKRTDEDTLYAQMEGIYQFDKDGKVIYQDDEESDADDITDADAEYIEYRTEGKIHKVWKMVDRLVLDVEGLLYEDVDKVLAKVWSYRDPKGFYKVILAMDDKLIPAKFNVEEIDIDEVSDYILSLSKGNEEQSISSYVSIDSGGSSVYGMAGSRS